MAFNFETTVKEITDFFKNEAKTETVVGKSFELGQFTCVPVIKFGIGLGYGGGEGKGGQQGKASGEGTGGGAGGGVGVEPIGFLVTHNDQISFIPAKNSKGLGAAFEKVPDLIEKLMSRKKTEKDEAAV
jgi:uncharacterized spore protein YtfJ